VVHRSIDGLTGVPCLGVEATPAFIVFAAFVGAFGPPPPELVLSGINHGPNTGYAVLHSSTVGAALTATTHVPGTDAGLVYAGWATVTALVAPCEAVGSSLDGLVDSAGTSPAAD
jgi:hypothetical protein